MARRYELNVTCEEMHYCKIVFPSTLVGEQVRMRAEKLRNMFLKDNRHGFKWEFRLTRTEEIIEEMNIPGTVLHK